MLFLDRCYLAALFPARYLATRPSFQWSGAESTSASLGTRPSPLQTKFPAAVRGKEQSFDDAIKQLEGKPIKRCGAGWWVTDVGLENIESQYRIYPSSLTTQTGSPICTEKPGLGFVVLKRLQERLQAPPR